MAPIVPFWATRDQAQAPTSHSFISHPSPFSAFAFPFPLLLVPFSLYLIHSQICKVTHKTKQLLSLRSPNFACKFLDSGGSLVTSSVLPRNTESRMEQRVIFCLQSEASRVWKSFARPHLTRIIGLDRKHGQDVHIHHRIE